MTPAQAAVWSALLDIWRAARAAGVSPGWGVHRRLKDRFGEFGLPDDYGTAVVAAGCALDASREGIVPAHDLCQALASTAGYPLPDSGYPLLPDALLTRMAAEAAADPLNWAACQRLAHDYETHGLAIPEPLRLFASAAVGDVPGSERRQDEQDAEARARAVVFAVRLALETGAFRGAELTPLMKQLSVDMRGGRALSACSLVASLKPGTAETLGYDAVAALWRRRNERART